MHVSISKLGSNQSGSGGAARAVVEYLTGREKRPAGDRGAVPELAEQTTAGGYYADAAEAPGRWYGAGVEDLIPAGSRDAVRAEHLEQLLLGVNPSTGEQIIGANGSAGRATPETWAHVEVAARGPADELLNSEQAAKLIGLGDKRYVNDLARKTAKSEAAIERATEAGETVPELPATRLHGTKVQGERQNRPEWRFERGEVERFIAARTEPKVVMGFDVTYSAAKETSLAWAVADDAGRAAIEASFRDEAVGKAMTYLEDNAAFARRGRDTEASGGFIGAGFVHTTSRELEPQLHVHVVVANVTKTTDIDAQGAAVDRWQTLDARGLYAQAGTSGYVAEAELQTQLNAQGYSHGPTVKGISHLEGIPAETVAAMSSGRQRIMEEVGAVGADSPAARQLAALATRPAKDTSVDVDELTNAWQSRFAETGFGPAQQAALVERNAPQLWTPGDTDRLQRHLLGPSGVTEQVAMFDRRHVVESITDFSDGRLSADEVLAHADAFLVSEGVIKMQIDEGRVKGDLIGTEGKVTMSPGLDLFTTDRVVRIERAIDGAYVRGHDVGAGQVNPAHVDAAIAGWQHQTGFTLGDDQAAMVRAITTSGDRMQAVLGPAGSGKTAALEVAARAWEADGYKLFGAAVNGNAAEVLQQSTGIESSTVASLVKRLDFAEANNRPLLDARSVVIVDEAGTLGNRDHARLVHHVEQAGATMRAVGDPAQHQSVDAGGMWAHLTRKHPERTPELVENRRMSGPEMAEMRLAAEEYRTGKISQAIERINTDERFVTAGTGNELLDTLATDWYVDWRRHQNNPDVKPSRMLAENHAARNELNHRAQTLLKADGTLTGEGVRIGDSTFHVGDEVVARTQNRQLRPEGGDRKSYVRNGTKGTVVGIGDGDQPGLAVNFENRGVIDVPHEWLTKKLREGVTGGLTPAYAMTTHASQGDTFYASHSLVTDRSSTEGQYVALTRGTDEVRFYAVNAAEFQPASPAVEHGLPVIENTRETIDGVRQALTRPRAADLATVSDLDVAAVVQLYNLDLGLGELEQMGTAHADRIADHIVDRATQQVKADPPAPLVAMLGERNPADAQGWDTAAESFAIYHERWQAPIENGRLAAVPEPNAPTEQHRDYAALKHDLVTARAHNNRHLDVTDLATLNIDLKSRHIPVDQSVLDPGITRQLESIVASKDRLVGAHETVHAKASKPKAMRQDPNGAEATRRELTAAKRELAVAKAHLADHKTTMAARPDTTAVVERHGMEQAMVDRLIGGHVNKALATPADYRTTALGSRPASPQRAAQWDRAARSIETYRHGTLGKTPAAGPIAPTAKGATHAIGPRPTNPVQAQQWTQTKTTITAVLKPITAPTLRPGR